MYRLTVYIMITTVCIQGFFCASKRVFFENKNLSKKENYFLINRVTKCIKGRKSNHFKNKNKIILSIRFINQV